MKTTAELEQELNLAGYFLRDDRSIREGVEQFKGHKEAYSLHRWPFLRFAVYSGDREWAVKAAHGRIMNCQHRTVIEGPRTPLVHGSAATEECDTCGRYRTLHHKPGPWLSGPVPTETDDEAGELTGLPSRCW